MVIQDILDVLVKHDPQKEVRFIIELDEVSDECEISEETNTEEFHDRNILYLKLDNCF